MLNQGGHLAQGKQPTFDDNSQEFTGPLVNQSLSGSCLSIRIGPLEQVVGDQVNQLKIRE